MTMTLSQAKGMLRFHKSAYKAYLVLDKVTGKYGNSNQAHDRMIQAYLLVRSLRPLVCHCGQAATHTMHKIDGLETADPDTYKGIPMCETHAIEAYKAGTHVG